MHFEFSKSDVVASSQRPETVEESSNLEGLTGTSREIPETRSNFLGKPCVILNRGNRAPPRSLSLNRSGKAGEFIQRARRFITGWGMPVIAILLSSFQGNTL